MTTVKVGMIGAGQIAYNHCRAVNSHPQGRVVAVADPNAERAEQLKAEFELEKTCAGAKELIADPEIDAVCIAVPNKFHAPLSEAALAAGKHVLLDKPFALNRAEAQRVLEAAQKSGKVFLLGMNFRYLPAVQAIRRSTRAGTLGEVYHAKATLMRHRAIPKLGTWFGNKELAGGGVLLDLGVHLLDACLYAMDNFEPVAVTGAVYSKFGHRGLGEGSWGMSDRDGGTFDVEDFATALIKMKNGATVQLDVSWMLHMQQARQVLHLFGTEAGASAFPEPKLFRFGTEDYEATELAVEPLEYAHKDRHANWLNVILGVEAPATTPEQALTVQTLLDAIYASSETGQEVRLG